MKKFALLALLATTSIAMAAEANATAAAAPAAAAPAAANGAALFAKCAGCHGADGKTKALGKSNPIAGMAAADVVKDLEGYKAGTLNQHGMGGVMKGQANMSADDMKALGEYISKLAK